LTGRNFDRTIMEVKRQIAEIKECNITIDKVKTMLKNVKEQWTDIM